MGSRTMTKTHTKESQGNVPGRRPWQNLFFAFSHRSDNDAFSMNRSIGSISAVPDCRQTSGHEIHSGKEDNLFQPAMNSRTREVDSPVFRPFGGACYFYPHMLQTKMEVSSPMDKYEIEADRVAEQIMRMPKAGLERKPEKNEEKTVQTKPFVSEITPLVQSQVVPEKEEVIQTKRIDPSTPAINSCMEADIRALGKSGQPLSGHLRAFFEPRFGHDFSRVRIHTNPAASELARSINARAFTIGTDVVFDRGQYSPDTRDGRRLLAHELTHCLQQTPAAIINPEHEKGGLKSVAGAERSGISHFSYRPPLARNQVAGTDCRYVQRVEHGTYISTHGERDYLQGAERFYRSWGYPNVRRVNNMQDILTDLNRRARRTVDTFRIVSHAHHGGLMLGLMQDFSPDAFDRFAAGRSTSEQFRGFWSNMNLVDSVTFSRFLRMLREHDSTRDHLSVLGVNQGMLDESCPVGIVLRAVLDSYFLRNVRLQTGTVPVLPNHRVLEDYNRRRISTYRQMIINAAPANERGQVTNAIASLISQAPIIIQQSGLIFTITQEDAQGLGDDLGQEVRGSRTLRRDINRAITEGANGAFVGLLAQVKSKITPATHVKIRGCTVGSNTGFLDAVQDFFSRPARPAVPAGGRRRARPAVSEARPLVSAPDIFQYYFPLDTYAYGTTLQQEEQMEADWQERSTGIEASYHRMVRMRNREMIQVVDTRTNMDELCRRYGFDIDLLREINPHLTPNRLQAGDIVWLKAVPIFAGQDSRLEAFCQRHLQNRFAWPRIWGYNPTIRNPSNLNPNDSIWVVPANIRQRAGEGAPAYSLGDYRTGRGFQDYRREVREGSAFVSIRQNRPTMWLDAGRRRRGEAAAEWITRQGFDYRRRAAAVLARQYTRNFGNAMRGTYIQFLARHYPIESVTDPIFPEDPRYGGHIITRH